MAGLTREQRELKQAEEKKKLEASIRANLEKEYAEKLAKANENSNKVNRTKIDIPSNTLIPVISGVHGVLVYVSKKTFGYTIEWEDYNSIEYLEYAELLSMRNTQKGFFENNWIFIEDTDEYTAQDIYKSLAIDKYYSNVIVGTDVEELFKMSPEEITTTISKLSSGIKQNIASVAKGKIETGELDSIKRISALEKALNLEFSPSY